MKVKKCDICKKIIKEKDKDISIYHNDRSFTLIELCSKCAQPITKFLKSKKLIKDEMKKLKSNNF